jgi:tetratricopeptide (TPR) repeat protein
MRGVTMQMVRLFGLAAILAASAAAFSASISGKVVFPEATPKAKITVSSSADDKRTAALTSDGDFSFTELPAGDYRIEIVAGKRTVEVEQFFIDEGANEAIFYFSPASKDAERFAAARDAFAEGSILLQRGEYAPAIAKFEESLMWDTAQAPTWGSMSLAQVGLRRYSDATFSAMMAIRHDRTESAYRNNLGGIYFRERRYRDALAQYLAAAELNPEGVGLYLSNAGAALVALGRDAEAATAMEKAVTDAACPPGTWFHLGAARQRSGNPSGAKAAYQRYLEIAPAGQYADNAKRALEKL